MKVKLIRSSKSRDVLEHECTIVIKASYKNAAYQDMFSYAGKSANIQMELYTASIEALRQRPSGSIISSTNTRESHCMGYVACQTFTAATRRARGGAVTTARGQRYGVISLAEGSETRNYHACWMHVMKMRLVLLSDLENVRLIDMQVKEAQDVRGQNRDLNWSVVMALDRDEDCWIMVEVLSLEVEL
ncbi:hypothetical protein BGZ83_006591 [Gryganskiella cystojenkinii]|nr:hypothetical protein BGZ83_006591 [Gryganskiella cystojenkinii]